MPPFRDDAQSRIVRAERDLLIAQRSFDADPPLREFTAFNTQQAVEKTLKWYLTAFGVRFRKTHELEELVEQCSKINADFLQFLPHARVLSPFAAEFRYPDGPIEPNETIAWDALRRADEVLSFVLTLLQNPEGQPENDE